jgi:hypothetical protein
VPAEPTEPTEHLVDRAMRLRSTTAAQKVIAAFVASHQAELAALLATYADDEAGGKLATLREQFWGYGGPVAEELERQGEP